MSEEIKAQCPACTAELTPGTIECPWCGYLMPPKREESLVDVILGSQSEDVEPEPVAEPSEAAQPQEEIIEPEAIPEPLPETPLPEASVYPVSEPGLTELPTDIRRSPASTLKVMGIFLTIFSFLALVFFIFQVIKGTLTQSVLLLPIFGMMIGLISVAVAQRR